MSRATAQQLGRVARLIGFTILGALLSSPLAHTWLARYPAAGLVVGVLEALYRTAVPTQPAPKVTSEPAQPAPPGKGTP